MKCFWKKFKKVFIFGLIGWLTLNPFVPVLVMAEEPIVQESLPPISTPTPSISPPPSTTPSPEDVVITGDAISVAESVSEVNTTNINSEVETATILVTSDTAETITPFPSPSPIIASTPTPSPNPSPNPSPEPSVGPSVEPSPEANTSTLNIANEAESTSTAQTTSTTGENTQISTNDAVMQTGDAVAIATSLSLTNTTLIDSTMQVGVIAILEAWNGDIVLDPPIDKAGLPDLSTFVAPLQITNHDTIVTTSSSAVATTGDNTQNASGNTMMTTGSATALSESTSIVNMTLVDADIFELLTQNLWMWSGMIRNWEYYGSVQTPGEWLSDQNSRQAGTACNGSCSVGISIDNQAAVSTTATAFASTGGNTQESDGNASISTGDAMAGAVSTAVVNTTLINSRYRQLSLLLFAPWAGDLVFSRPIVTEEQVDPPNVDTDTSDQGETESDKKSEGSNEVPQLRLESSNNVHGFVHPGDGVTYDMTATNNGPIEGRNVKLIQNFYTPAGELMSEFGGSVGSLQVNQRKGIRFVLTTGAALPEGNYYTESYLVGESDQGVSTRSNTVHNSLVLRAQKQVMSLAGKRVAALSTEQENILGAAIGTKHCNNCLSFPWYVAITLGSMAYYAITCKRRDYSRAIKWGLALPLSAYAGLILSNHNCANSYMLLPSAGTACLLFLPIAYGIYFGVMVGGRGSQNLANYFRQRNLSISQ